MPDFGAIAERRSNAAGSILSVSFDFISGAVLLYPLLYVTEYVATISSMIGIFLYGLLLLVSWLTVAFIAMPSFSQRDAWRDSASKAATVSLLAVIGIVSFGQLSRHLHFAFGGFAATQLGYWTWVSFGVDEFINAISFDFFSIYGWRLADIDPISIWSRSLRFSFHVSLLALIVASLYRQWHIASDTWRPMDLRRLEPHDGRRWIVFVQCFLYALAYLSTVGVYGVSALRERAPYLDVTTAFIPVGIASIGVGVAVLGLRWWQPRKIFLYSSAFCRQSL